jgi:hypothetical protein
MQKIPVITDRNEFLTNEYEQKFKRIFKTYKAFEQAMAGYTRTCRHCKALHWMNTKKPCECDYEEILKLQQELKKTQP